LNNLDISVIVPLKDEAESLPELCAWIERVMHAHQFSFEVILVDDGSEDDSWEFIKNISVQKPDFKGISLNRNYGKSAALNIGFQMAQGKVVITMDADLQDSPDEIPELYRMISHEKYDLVSGWKKNRRDSFIKNETSKFYNAVTRWFSGIKLHDFNCGLKAYNRRVIKNIEVYGEMHRYIPVIAKWAGYRKIGEKVVQHQARKYGKTKFGLERFVYGFLDLLTISFVSRFRKRPMHFFGVWGTISFLLGFFFTIYLAYDKYMNVFYRHTQGREIVDQPLFYLALVAILAGIQLFLAGFVGEMITTNSHKTTDYVISEKINLD
jgi:glycosyltransferase involved in cell wall biosynthesis